MEGAVAYHLSKRQSVAVATKRTRREINRNKGAAWAKRNASVALVFHNVLLPRLKKRPSGASSARLASSRRPVGS